MFLTDEEKARCAYLYRRLALGVATLSELQELKLYLIKAIEGVLWYHVHGYIDVVRLWCRSLTSDFVRRWYFPTNWSWRVANYACITLDEIEKTSDIVKIYEILDRFFKLVEGTGISEHEKQFLKALKALRKAKRKSELVIVIDGIIQTLAHRDISICELIFPPEFMETLDWLREFGYGYRR